MIVYLTVPGHAYTLKKLKPTKHGFPVPDIQFMSYERLFRAFRLPRATYIFTDIERLTFRETRVAAEYYNRLKALGMRCLNNPAAVKTRFELLHNLYQRKQNPFAVYRADETPKPRQFPVFLRSEEDHRRPLSGLIDTQENLDKTLDKLAADGVPRRGLIVVEQYSKEFSPGRWHKWGTFRVGDRYSVDHIAVDDNWLVKTGSWDLQDDMSSAAENVAVTANACAEPLKSAFDLACIEYGRADYSQYGEEVVVYEINTNPYIGRFVPDPIPKRLESQLIARRRIAEMLSEVDSDSAGKFRMDASPHWTRWKAYRPGLVAPKRP